MCIKMELVEGNPDAIRLRLPFNPMNPNSRTTYIIHTFVLPGTAISAFICSDQDGHEIFVYEGVWDSPECGGCVRVEGGWMPVEDAEFWFDSDERYTPEAIKTRMDALPRSGHIPYQVIEEFIQ